MGRGQVLGPGWCYRPHVQYQAQSRAGWEPGGQGRQCSWAPVCSSGASSPCLPHSQMLQPGFEGNRAQAYSSTQDCLGLVLQPPAVLYPAWQPSPSLCVLRSYVRAALGATPRQFYLSIVEACFGMAVSSLQLDPRLGLVSPSDLALQGLSHQA